jgi:hypothetical protein
LTWPDSGQYFGSHGCPKSPDWGASSFASFADDARRHRQPHFHAVDPDQAVVVSLPELAIIAGRLRRSREVIAWARQVENLRRLVGAWNRGNPDHQSQDRVSMIELRRIKAVRALPGHQLHVTWRDGNSDSVDMTGVVNHLPLFAPLKDAAAFAAVRPVAYGSGIEWQNGLDYSADSLASLAEVQRRMTGKDFRRWKQQMRLSLREVADLFGMAPSTMKTYLSSERELPIAFQIACLAMQRDKAVFLARYRPRSVGRPRRERAA